MSKMRNTLVQLPFYKSRSIMIVEASMGVDYNITTPFVQFKFATRADYKSQGQWDDNNSYWITSYNMLFDFVRGMHSVAQGKQELYELKNPSKGTAIQIRSSHDDKNNADYIVFSFYRGDIKIHVSLGKGTEFQIIFGYFKNLMENYNTVSAIALMRNDYWYETYGKKYDNGGESSGKSYESKFDQDKGGDRMKNNGSSGGGSSSNDFDDSSSSGNDFDDDIPF